MTTHQPCVSCGEAIEPSDKFCKHCGTTNAHVCGSCGGSLDPGAKFCKHCGEASKTTAAPRAPKTTSRAARSTSKPTPPAASSGVPPWAIAAGVALLGLVIYFVATSSQSSSPKTLKIAADRPDQPLPGAKPGGAPAPGTAPKGKPAPKGPSPQDISGTVEVSEELKAVLPNAAALYIIARPAAQPTAFPIAVVRVDPKPPGPVPFTIGPANLMMAGGDFSQPVVLSARWDQDGNASSKEPGDLFGQIEGPTKPGSKAVKIVLSQRL